MERKAFCSSRLPNVVRNYTFTGMEAVEFSRVEIETGTLKTTEGITQSFLLQYLHAVDFNA